MTSYEHDFLMDGLTKMFRCDFDDLPTECHVNWWTLEKERSSGFFKCLVDSNATTPTRGHPLYCQRDARTPHNKSLPHFCGPWLSKSLKVSQWGLISLITRYMGPTWGPPGADRTQVGTMLAPWILLSGYANFPRSVTFPFFQHYRNSCYILE